VLQIRGKDILTFGDYATMMKGLTSPGPTEGVLQAWFLGEDVDPTDLHECLDIEARPNCETPESLALIGYALDRLEELFPAELAQ
jgi:hypothetical protein